MDEGFAEEFSAQNQSFLKAYKAYLDSARDGELGTAEKNKANNRLYKDMMHMFTDAKMIFAREPEMLKHFVFESVLLLVSGPGTSGIKGSVSVREVTLPDLSIVELSLKENGETISVNEDGSYRFSHIGSGIYTLHVSAPGYKEQDIPGIQVNVGSYTIQNILLEKLQANL